ncbi:hypothetical protein GGS24DRAFT_476988 [Hypoxylon argillaceum]|nr:hypothetical protein GGS24DRAFT_476988 [Hypoxylon argillaceum]
MNRALSPGMPDRVGLSGHYQAITDGFQLHENSPAFTDPDISTKLGKLDEFTNTMDSFKDDMTRFLRQAIKDEMKSVKEDLESVKEDLESVKEDLESVKEDLESAKDDLIKEIKTVEKSLRINIATRNTNAIARAKNQWGDEIVPLRSVLSGAAIDRFPTTRLELEGLSKVNAVRILRELDDLLIYNSDSNTVSAIEARERLAMLVGITRRPFVDNNNV